MQPKIRRFYTLYFMYIFAFQAASFLMISLIVKDIIDQKNYSPAFPGIDLKEFK